ncbi:MAG: polysaccharide deacetylase family protein [Bacillaceae bacterium]
MARSQQKLVSLTFDDGPSLYTNQILDILDGYNVKATFFVVGEAVSKYPEIIKRIKKEKHVIGNHTWNHPSIFDISSSELSNQILKTNAVIKKILNEEPTLFRAPYGNIGRKSFQLIQDLGLTSVLWNVDSLDWSFNERSLIKEQIKKYILSDSIILLHDGDAYGSGPRDVTVKSLPRIIDYLIQEGYKFITIPEFHQQRFKIEKW